VSIAVPGTPWYFRYRSSLFGAAYGGGFFFGYLITSLIANGTNRPGLMEPTFTQLGRLVPALGTRGALGSIFLAVTVGWLWRVWGASYLSSAVVWSPGVETGSLHVAGPYRFVRNPLYFGNLCWALALGAFGPPLVTALVVGGNWLLIEALIRSEEGSLEFSYGAGYARYAALVPRLLPLFLRSAPASSERPAWTQGLRSEIWGLGFVLLTGYCFVTERPPGFLFVALGFLLVLSGLFSPAKSAEAR
jgi:protein-S-isoprenylcysteine O-methyltransferase Ste14